MKKQGIVWFCVLLSMMLFAQGCASDNNLKSNTSENAEFNANENAEINANTVTIDGFRLVKTTSDKNVIIVEYTFTNTTDGATAFVHRIQQEVSQNGIVLESFRNAILEENANYSSNAFTKIKPGVTIKVEQAYFLENAESDVVVELASHSAEDYKVSKTFNIK